MPRAQGRGLRAFPPHPGQLPRGCCCSEQSQGTPGSRTGPSRQDTAGPRPTGLEEEVELRKGWGDPHMPLSVSLHWYQPGGRWQAGALFPLALASALLASTLGHMEAAGCGISPRHPRRWGSVSRARGQGGGCGLFAGLSVPPSSDALGGQRVPPTLTWIPWILAQPALRQAAPPSCFVSSCPWAWPGRGATRTLLPSRPLVTSTSRLSFH